MALQQYKVGQTYYGFDPQTQQGIAFGDEPTSKQYFQTLDANAPAPTFDVSKLNSTPNQLLSLGPAPTVAPQQPQQTPTQQVGNPRIDELTKLLFTPPASTQKLYQDAYNTSGLTEIKTRLADLDKRIAETKQRYTTKEGEINENPFLSEASRIGRLGRLKDMMEAETGNLLDEYKQYANLYGQGLNEVEASIGRGTTDIDNQRKIYADELNYLLGLQDKQEQRVYDFAKANNILYPFYKYPGNPQVFDARTGEPVSYEEYKKRGGLGIPDGAWPDIQELQSQTVQEERALVADLASKYVDAGIGLKDTLATAQAKVSSSRIYKEQVRPPVGTGGGGGGVGVLGLTNQQIDNISPLVTQFQNSPIVQNYNTIGEGYSFVQSLSNKTTNPADDQALIYALAKALDPGSVVREGEYATVQKYAQSMVSSYGKSVTQALSGTGFLSESARKNIKSTIESRFKAAETSYKNLYSETERRVNLIGNTDKGSQLLNNYGGAFAPTSSSSSFVGPVNPNTSTTQPSTQSFWQKATNWLFGD